MTEKGREYIQQTGSHNCEDDKYEVFRVDQQARNPGKG